FRTHVPHIEMRASMDGTGKYAFDIDQTASRSTWKCLDTVQNSVFYVTRISCTRGRQTTTPASASHHRAHRSNAYWPSSAPTGHPAHYDDFARPWFVQLPLPDS